MKNLKLKLFLRRKTYGYAKTPMGNSKVKVYNENEFTLGNDLSKDKLWYLLNHCFLFGNKLMFRY